MSKKTIHKQEYSILIQLLRQKRECRGVTQANLAIDLGFDQTFISKIENSERRLDIIELRTICHSLDMTLIEFIQELEDKLILVNDRS